jgi:hypothetical protein
MYHDFHSILQKYPENISNYMDDRWIVTANNKEGKRLHTQIIHEFLNLMEEKSYFLKPKKCQFEKDSMEILGWLVGGGKIQINPAKVKGISEWPRELKNKEEDTPWAYWATNGPSSMDSLVLCDHFMILPKRTHPSSGLLPVPRL